MGFNLIKQTWVTITYNSSFQKIFSLLFILIFFFGCEKEELKSIKINDDLILIAGSKNKNGCTQFSLKSKSGKPTIQLIYFADKYGNYSASEKKIKNCI
tara:strand:- start:557 stop:853 length:297 start_codon:yes stop_codon:yes gene_type:complete